MSNFVCMTRKSKPFTVQIGLERAINKTKMRAKMNTEGINQKHYPEEVSIKIEKYESENGRMLSVAKGFFLLLLRHKRNLGIVVHTSIRIFSMYIVRMYREILITYRSYVYTHTHIYTHKYSHTQTNMYSFLSCIQQSTCSAFLQRSYVAQYPRLVQNRPCCRATAAARHVRADPHILMSLQETSSPCIWRSNVSAAHTFLS